MCWANSFGVLINTASFQEDHKSQVPVLQLLQHLGYGAPVNTTSLLPMGGKVSYGIPYVSFDAKAYIWLLIGDFPAQTLIQDGRPLVRGGS